MRRTDNHQGRRICKLFPVGFVHALFGIVKTFCVIFSVIGMLLDLPMGVSPAQAVETVQDAKSVKTIIVGDYYPYTFMNDHGIPDGFSVDIAKAVTGVMGLKLEIRVDTWERATRALADGAIDFLPMMAASPERDKTFDFSVPHTIAYDAIFSRTGTQRTSSLKDLANQTVIVMNRDVAHQYLLSSGMAAKMKLILVDSLPDALRTLAVGKGDAALMPKLVGLIVMRNLNLTNLDSSPVVIEAYNRPFCFAVKDGNQVLLERLSQGLSIIKTTGQYQEIYRKWFGALEAPGLSWRIVIKYIGGLVAIFSVIGLGLILWTVSLRRQVALQTRHLETEIQERRKAEGTLRESEDKYRLVVENAEEIILIAQDGLLKYVNPMAVKILGYSEEVLTSMPFVELLHPEDIHKVFEAHIRIMRGEENEPVHQFRVVTLDGTVRWADSHAVVISWEGKPATLNFITDITERKRAEEENLRLVERLQRAEKMEALGALAGGVAHDLNNVLGIVVGYAGMLLDDVEEASPIRSELMNILSGGERAAAIVQDLLTLARRGVANRKILNLSRMVVDWRNSSEFKTLASYHPSVQTRIDLEPNSLNISGSPVHIGKTLFNLASNGCEAMPNGGVLTIRTANQYIDKPVQGYDEVREGDYVVLSVSDTGEGIPSDDLKRIFEPFYTKKVMGRSGTGLGLAVVWGTVKDHHGYINVQSEEGKGSTFTLYFPVTREEITADQAALPAAAYMGRGESILIVDDVKGQRELAAAMLRKLNYSVSSVAGGEDALAYLKEHDTDLLVLDMIMDPGMDGLDTYRKVLEIHPQQKAIIVSGFSESERVTAAQALGAGAYVKKPYVSEQLGLAVRKELDPHIKSGGD